MRPGFTNEISIAAPGAHVLQLQINAVWYEPWDTPRTGSKDISLDVRYDKKRAAIHEPVTCEVRVSRPAFRGYGMMIAEIGLPPGAEVDRGTLANIVEGIGGVDSFEVAPDHVTFYLWPSAADTKFRFVFRPRFAMNARARQSLLYDYYNPDERVTHAPERFIIE